MEKLNKRTRQFMLCMFFACTAWILVAAVGAQAAPSASVKLNLGKADTYNLKGNVADILVANPDVADVGILRANRLYIVGRGVGDTNVLAFDDKGELLADIAVHVRIDQKTMAETLKEFFPDEKVKVRTVNEDIVLTGRVSTPSVANQVRDLAGRFVPNQDQTIVDLMSVAGEQQVMLKVKIVEANRSVLREFGIETDYKYTAGVASDMSGGEFNAIAGTGLTADPFGIGSIFFDDNNGFGPLEFTLQALERDGFVNTLAEPNLTAISGETAGFLAGGEFPVPTGTDEDGNVLIEFRAFGVALNFRPTVLSRDRISLQLSTEVSSLADQDGVTLAGVEIPGLSVRRAETTVEMGSGGSLMMAGLIKSDTANALNGLPGVNDLPVIGELFKSKSFARNESELLILVTAYLVEPIAKADGEKVQDERNVSVLSKAFLDNLQKTYGKKVPKDLDQGPAFGYFID